MTGETQKAKTLFWPSLKIQLKGEDWKTVIYTLANLVTLTRVSLTAGPPLAIRTRWLRS